GDPNQNINCNDPNLFEPSAGPRHNLCAAQPWINGITPSDRSASFHPDQNGNNAMAHLVEEVFPKLDWSGLGTATASQVGFSCVPDSAYAVESPGTTY